MLRICLKRVYIDNAPLSYLNGCWDVLGESRVDDDFEEELDENDVRLISRSLLYHPHAQKLPLRYSRRNQPVRSI